MTPDWVEQDLRKEIERLKAQLSDVTKAHDNLQAEARLRSLAGLANANYYNRNMERLERELAEKSEQVDSLISEVTSMKCAHVHPSIRWASKQMWNYVMGRDVSAATVAEVTHAIEAKESELTQLRGDVYVLTNNSAPLIRELDIARKDNERLREALTHYARPFNWDEYRGTLKGHDFWKGEGRGPDIARKALHPSQSKPEDV